jgi:hypothetical protein
MDRHFHVHDSGEVFVTPKSNCLYVIIVTARSNKLECAVAAVQQAGRKNTLIFAKVLDFCVGQLLYAVKVLDAHTGNYAIKKQGVYDGVRFGF